MVRLHSQESSSELVNGYLHCFLGFCGIGPFGLTFHYADPYGSAEPSISYRNLRAATPRTLSNAQSSIFIEVCPYDNILSYPSDKPHRLVGAEKRKQILHCLEANLFARDAAELGPQAPRMKPPDTSVENPSRVFEDVRSALQTPMGFATPSENDVFLQVQQRLKGVA